MDGGEGTEAGEALGESESEDGVVLEVGGEPIGVVGLGGEDGGGGEVFDEVLFAVVEGVHGDVAGGAIEGEDDILDVVVVELFTDGLDEPLVELLADFLEFLGVAVGVAEVVLEFEDFGGEVFAGDGDGFAVEDYACFSGLGAPDEPEFVVEDEGIEEEGFDFGVGEDDVLGVAGEFFGLELGGVLFFLGFEGGFEAFDELVKGCIGAFDFGCESGSLVTFGLFALGELGAEGDFVVEGGGDGLF